MFPRCNASEITNHLILFLFSSKSILTAFPHLPKEKDYKTAKNTRMTKHK